MNESKVLPEPESIKELNRISAWPAIIRAGWHLLIFLVAFGVLQGVLGFALTTVVPSLRGALATMGKGVLTPFGLLALESVNLVAALIAIRIMAAIEHRSLSEYRLRRWEAFGPDFRKGVGWGFATVVALFLALRIEGVFSFGPLALHGWAIAGYAAVWAGGALLVGLFEELVFRGYMLSMFTTAIGFWPAAVISSVLFGAAHMMNPGVHAVIGLSAAVFGFFFCLTVRRTGTLWFAVGMHSAFDYGETFLFAPTGGTSSSAHLLNSSLHGPGWLTGGHVGPEASVNGAFAFLLLLILFHRLYRSRNTAAERPYVLRKLGGGTPRFRKVTDFHSTPEKPS